MRYFGQQNGNRTNHTEFKSSYSVTGEMIEMLVVMY